MKLVFSATALGAALVLAAAVSVGAQGTGGSPGKMGHMGGMMMAKAPLTISMKALNGSTETGTAVLTDSAKGLVVSLKIKNSKGQQPAHIHKGSCAKLDPKPEEALHNVVNGTSLTTVPGLTIAKLLASPHAINVHKSLSDLPTYVSCGDIAKSK